MIFPTYSEHRQAWFSLYCAAIGNGRTPEGAAQFADEALKLYADRYEMLEKWERQRDYAIERLKTRSRQVDVGLQAIHILAAVRSLAKELPYDDKLVRLFQNYQADRIVDQCHEIGRQFVIVPYEKAIPKEDDTENPLFRGEDEVYR